MQAARSRLQDTDFAQATADKAANDILSQSTSAVAVQARQSQQSVLNLLS